MKIKVDKDGEILVGELYNGIGIPTDKGLFGIAQRDDGIDVLLDGKQVYPPEEELLKVTVTTPRSAPENYMIRIRYGGYIFNGWGKTQNKAMINTLRRMVDYLDKKQIDNERPNDDEQKATETTTEDEYDESTCITAGQLRAMGLDIKEYIPDCAWIPRYAMKISSGKVSGDPEKGMMNAQMNFEFTKSFTWYSVDFKISPDGKIDFKDSDKVK